MELVISRQSGFENGATLAHFCAILPKCTKGFGAGAKCASRFAARRDQGAKPLKCAFRRACIAPSAAQKTEA